jgi:hypothetical protein
MDTSILIIKKIYNHMDSLNVPQTILWPLNTVNFAVGVAQNSNLNYISAVIGIVLNLIWHLYKFYRQIKIDEKADALNNPNSVDLDSAPMERQCLGCGKMFEIDHIDQVFHDYECKDDYLSNLKSRTPFKKTEEQPNGPLSTKQF